MPENKKYQRIEKKKKTSWTTENESCLQSGKLCKIPEKYNCYLAIYQTLL